MLSCAKSVKTATGHHGALNMAVRVIDTDVWSYLYKGSNEAKLYEPHLFGNILVISFQT